LAAETGGCVWPRVNGVRGSLAAGIFIYVSGSETRLCYLADRVLHVSSLIDQLAA